MRPCAHLKAIKVNDNKHAMCNRVLLENTVHVKSQGVMTTPVWALTWIHPQGLGMSIHRVRAHIRRCHNTALWQKLTECGGTSL